MALYLGSHKIAGDNFTDYYRSMIESAMLTSCSNEIPRNSNLNTYIISSTHVCRSQSVASTLSNPPALSGFLMWVLNIGTDEDPSIVHLALTEHGEIYVRYNTVGDSWSAWTSPGSQNQGEGDNDGPHIIYGTELPSTLEEGQLFGLIEM